MKTNIYCRAAKRDKILERVGQRLHDQGWGIAKVVKTMDHVEEVLDRWIRTFTEPGMTGFPKDTTKRLKRDISSITTTLAKVQSWVLWDNGHDSILVRVHNCEAILCTLDTVRKALKDNDLSR